jgi:glycosyltransferase involved in cell wall biosynthesis
MKTPDYIRVKPVFLFPSLARGAYWQPVFAEFVKMFPQTVVVTGLWEGFLDRYKDAFRVEVVGRTRFVKIPLLKPHGHYPSGFVQTPIIGLIRTLPKIRPDVLFVSGFSFWSFLGALYKTLFRACLIVVYDGSSPSVDRQSSRIHRLWRRFLSRWADAFVTNTQAGRRYLMEFLGVPENQVFVHPYQVPAPDLWQNQNGRPSLDRVTFIYVGQLIPQKGLSYLISAVRILKEMELRKYWELWLVGDGSLRSNLESQVKDLGLQNRVRFLGKVKYDELGALLSMADVFVFPTLEDVWGVAPLEAMAMGKPVVCSKYAGASEIIEDGVEGFVVDPMNVKEVANRMLCFIENPSLIQEMGRNSKEKMQKFTPKHAAKFLSDVILRCL